MKLKGVEEVCIAHGAAGAAAAASVIGSARCSAGLVLLAASPLPTAAPTTAATLVLAGELDGVYRLSHFAVARQAATASTSTLKFGVVLGASHHSFAAGAGTGVGVPPSATIPEAVAVLDLKQSLPASRRRKSRKPPFLPRICSRTLMGLLRAHPAPFSWGRGANQPTNDLSVRQPAPPDVGCSDDVIALEGPCSS